MPSKIKRPWTLADIERLHMALIAIAHRSTDRWAREAAANALNDTGAAWTPPAAPARTEEG